MNNWNPFWIILNYLKQNELKHLCNSLIDRSIDHLNNLWASSSYTPAALFKAFSIMLSFYYYLLFTLLYSFVWDPNRQRKCDLTAQISLSRSVNSDAESASCVLGKWLFVPSPGRPRVRHHGCASAPGYVAPVAAARAPCARRVMKSSRLLCGLNTWRLPGKRWRLFSGRVTWRSRAAWGRIL